MPQYLVLYQQTFHTNPTILTGEDPRPYDTGKLLWTGEPAQVPCALVERIIAKFRRHWGKEWNWVHQQPQAAWKELRSGAAVPVAQHDIVPGISWVTVTLAWTNQPLPQARPWWKFW